MKWFFNLRTKSKLFLGCAIFLLLLVAVTVIGYVTLRELVQSEKSLIENEVAAVIAMRDVRAHQNGMREDALVASIATDPATVETRIRDMQDRSETINRSMPLVLRELSSLPALREKVEEFERIRQQYEKTRLEEALPAMRAGRQTDARRLIMGVQTDRNEQMRRLANEVVAQMKVRFDEDVTRATTLADRAS